VAAILALSSLLIAFVESILSVATEDRGYPSPDRNQYPSYSATRARALIRRISRVQDLIENAANMALELRKCLGEAVVHSQRTIK
jgi:hypothetical protein